MTDLKKNVPELRFPEFSGEWEEKKLGEVLTVLDGDRGKNYPSGTDFSETGHTLFLSATNVTKNGFKFNQRQYITEEKSLSMGNGKLAENDVVLTTRGSIGNVGWYNKKIFNKFPFTRINSGMLILRTNNDKKAQFFSHFLNSTIGKRRIQLISFGSAQPQLTKKDIKLYKMHFPNIIEQQKIGDFFSKLDRQIELEEQKLTLLEEQKKGYMQKIFSQELRFKDDDGKDYPEWEKFAINDVYEVTRGNVLSKNLISNVKDNVNQYPVYSSQTTNNGLMGYYSSYLYEDAITWTTDGANAGSVSYRQGKFYCTNVCGVLLNEQGKSNKCMAEMLNNIAFKYVSKVGNPKLMNNVMKMIKLWFPYIEEQEKIGDFFNKLDQLIEKQSRKVDLLKQRKKGLLQKMFV
ncbi:restriction endonuclease subunit S [Staphylococcus delphini]|uniref:restriction endonuclease subunit S n=1 Tax=Staphylococcus delphini TaxID=53344 RepID=UPI0021CF8623|nr:restriction endonuclease subunit S [Staphylococcus delphini]UXS20776.1 restriction endonuclease subunit S [Staphylococcus delphini]UXS56782.1 restriction endonuclease subunit S [Staphylococcus delphini]